MLKNIPKKYKGYGDYVNRFRALPLDVDGLKPVERRVLLSAYLVAREKFTKCPRVDGTCIARFHPHSTTYGTIVQMVNQGFLIGQGQFGNKLGVDPSPAAAMRYTECKLNPYTYELMFKYIKHVPWVESESKDDKEPLFLPTMIPACLIGKEYTQGIGFGFRTLIPTYSIEDLYRRLMWLLKIRKTKPTIRPTSDCVISSNDSDLELLLTVGKANIKMEGVLKENPRQCKVTVKSWVPGKKFATILGKPRIKKLLDNNDIGYIDSSNDDVGTEIVFEVLKQRNRDKIYKLCLQALKEAVNGSVSFEITTTGLNGKTSVVSVDQMLLNTFNMYLDVNKKMLQYGIDKLEELTVEYHNLEKIKIPLSKVLQTGAITKENLQEKISYISKNSKLTIEIVKELLSKYRIQKLMTVNTDTNEILEKIKDLQKSLKNSNDFVLEQYNFIMKGKYNVKK